LEKKIKRQVRLEGDKDHQDPVKEMLEGEAKQKQKDDHHCKLSIRL